MFHIFEEKNKTGNLIKKLFGGCFIFLIVAMGTYGLVPKIANGQSDTSGDAGNPPTQQTGQQTSVGTNTNEDPEEESWLWSASKWLGDKTAGAILIGVSVVYYGFTIPLSAFLLWLSAELLETVISYSVLDLKQYIDPGSGVAEAWKVMRDFGNMFFIFILLYTAIMTILGLGGGDIKKIIVRVVIFALLINFSFFFTKVAIDASNIVSIAFYKQIVRTPCGESSEPAVNIGGAFMCHLGLTELFGQKALTYGAETFGSGIDGAAALMRFATLGSGLMLMLAIILTAAMAMFLVRFVTIILLLVLSPLAFAMKALPNDKYSDMWTHKLFENCVAAPAFMIMTWITLKVAASITNGQQGSIIDVIATNSLNEAFKTHIEASLNYFIIGAMMVATILVAKEFGAAGASWGIKALKGAQKMAIGSITKPVSMASGFAAREAIRQTVKRADDAMGKTAFGRSYYGQELRGMTTKAALKAKIGGKSVESVEKAVKDNQKKFVEEENKVIDKNTNKQIMTLRNEYISDLKKIDQLESQEKERQDKFKALEAEIMQEDKANAAQGITQDSPELAAKKNKLLTLAPNEDTQKLTDEIKKLREGISFFGDSKKLKEEIKTTERNIEEDKKLTGDAKKGFATGAELERFGNKQRRERIKKITDDAMWNSKNPITVVLSPLSKKDREHVREELAKKVRKVGQKDLQKVLKDALKESGDDEKDENKEGNKPEGGGEDKSK
jgi:hypothetical protein